MSFFRGELVSKNPLRNHSETLPNSFQSLSEIQILSGNSDFKSIFMFFLLSSHLGYQVLLSPIKTINFLKTTSFKKFSSGFN